jgi:hypothetical protein
MTGSRIHILTGMRLAISHQIPGEAKRPRGACFVAEQPSRPLRTQAASGNGCVTCLAMFNAWQIDYGT